jgi:hypothetical protein
VRLIDVHTHAFPRAVVQPVAVKAGQLAALFAGTAAGLLGI